MSVMYIRNEQTGEFEPVPSLVGPQGPPGANGGGAGTVTSVNKVAPDANGNVTLTAANVGALPSGGTAVNATQLNGKSADQYALKTDIPEDTGGDADTLGGKDPKYYLQPRNLLDNSDFLNPVNQRGLDSYTGAGYTIDRWYAITEGNNVTVNNGSITINGFIRQKVIVTDGRYTIAAKTTDGAVHIRQIELSGNVVTHIAGDESMYATYEGDYYAVGINSGNYLWVVLYEGEYTADNLPPYVSKGYAAELAECQRYDMQYLSSDINVMGKVTSSGDIVEMAIPVPVKMRKTPNFVRASNFAGYCYHPTDGTYKTITVVTVYKMSGNIITCSIPLSEGFATPYMLVAVRLIGGFSFDANL